MTAAFDVKWAMLVEVAIVNFLRRVQMVVAVRVHVMVIRADDRVAILSNDRFPVQAVHSVYVVPHCPLTVYSKVNG